jgi:hypothetical protein
LELCKKEARLIIESHLKFEYPDREITPDMIEKCVDGYCHVYDGNYDINFDTFHFVIRPHGKGDGEKIANMKKRIYNK